MRMWDLYGDERGVLEARTAAWAHGDERPDSFHWQVDAEGVSLASIPGDDLERRSLARLSRIDLLFYLCRTAPPHEVRARFRDLAALCPERAADALPDCRLEGEPGNHHRDVAGYLEQLDVADLLASPKARVRMSAISAVGRLADSRWPQPDASLEQTVRDDPPIRTGRPAAADATSRRVRV